jgi:SAM-dependent methyltransferase
VREHSADLERGVTGFSDDSVDVFVSASAIEHLTAGAQRRLFADVQRILKPGGVFCGTVSFIAGLTPETLALIQSDPLFEQTGSAVHAAFDLRACLAAAPLLRPPYPPLTWSQFPYFDGFDESDLIGSDAIIVNYVGSYGAMRFRPEVDALRLRWAELGLFLRKQAA